MHSIKRIGRSAIVPAAAVTIVMLVAACNTVQPRAAATPAKPTVTPLDVAGSVTGSLTSAASSLPCDGATAVTVSLTGAAGIAGDPKKIMLVIDVSGSVGNTGSDPNRFTNLKAAAKGFVHLMDVNTDGVANGTIGNGSSIGVVSFNDTATLEQGLTTNVDDLDAAIDGLVAQGYTNTAAGLTTAAASNPDVVILFTDGEPNRPQPQSTALNDAALAAANLRSSGAEIFAIGIIGTAGINIALLDDWTGDHSHVYVTPDSTELASLFEAAGAAIAVPAATNVTVVDTVPSGFDVSSASVDEGSVAVSGNTLTWTLDRLMTGTASLTYTITHDASTAGGTLPVSSSITYSDAEGGSVAFPARTVDVHGCAASLELAPASQQAPVGSSASLTATVADDFGDPVPGIAVDFGVTPGTSVVDGAPGAPMPAAGSGTTDGAGTATFAFGDTVAATDTVTATAAAQPSVASALQDAATVTWVPIPVTLDVPPSHGAKSQGVIPVTVLGSAGFDVGTIDAASVVFGRCGPPPPGAHIAHASGHAADVNGDGYGDVVYHFRMPQTGLTSADTHACLYGKTASGLDFMGTAGVRLVP